MVDVGEKPITARRAVAEATVRVSAALAKAIRANRLKKGSLCDTARLAGIQAAKRTDELIPLCHSLPLDSVNVDVSLVGRRVQIRAEARVHARTGVEMEALVAAAIAALTVIDMGKSIDRGIIVEDLRLIEKEGGRSGRYAASRRVS
jgi:cyclic pyranopterin phosphate synthase